MGWHGMAWGLHMDSLHFLAISINSRYPQSSLQHSQQGYNGTVNLAYSPFGIVHRQQEN